MRSFGGTKSLTIVLGVSLCGVTGYLLYLLFKKEEDDDYSSTIPKKSENKVVEVRIPKDMVRVVIGRNGNTVKSIQSQTNTEIHFKDEVNGEDERVCVIKGTLENCGVAENLIYEKITNQAAIQTVDIFIPYNCISRLVGRFGDDIEELAERTGAKIHIFDSKRCEPTRRLTITGTEDQIKLARSHIEQIVEKKQMMRKQLEESLAKRTPRTRPKSSTPSPTATEDPKSGEYADNPTGLDCQFEVYVSAMVDPSSFYLQVVGPKATELDLLVEEMTDYYNKPRNRERHALKELYVHALVAAPFQYDNKWYRAEVTKTIKNEDGSIQVELFFLDYGDTDIVTCKKLCQLRTDFLKLPYQAIECYLARVEPNGETWSEEAIDKFEEWTYVAQWKKMYAKVNGYRKRENWDRSKEPEIVGMDLYDLNNDRDINIAEELVKHGYAVWGKEQMPN